MLPAWPDRPPGQPAPYGKHTRYSQNKMNVKVKMAGGGGGGSVSGLSTGQIPLPLQHRSIALADCTVRGGEEGEENN